MAKFEEDLTFSSDESDMELEDCLVLKDVTHKPRKLSLTNRSNNSTGIHTLPPELLFEIFNYIDVKTLMTVVRIVSRYFYDFFNSQEFWEMRLANCFCGANAIQLTNSEMSRIHSIGLPLATSKIELGKSLSSKKHVERFTVSGSHYGDVHCVKILSGVNKVAVSGSRDKTICVYDLKLLGTQESSVLNTNTDHNGWVWTIDQEDRNSTRLVSGSWDSFIHLYELGRGDLEQVNKLSVHSAVLCTRFEANFLLYGTYSKYVVGYDTRSGKSELSLKFHTKPVLSISSSDNYIWSSGEDYALCCYDRRADKLLKRIRMERISSSISYTDPYLWVAGYDGYIKCFNSDMKIVSKFETGHPQPILDMTHSIGATATACKDGNVKVFSPNLHPQSWAYFSLDNSASCIDYRDGLLMAGCCDSTVTFWQNKY